MLLSFYIITHAYFNYHILVQYFRSKITKIKRRQHITLPDEREGSSGETQNKVLRMSGCSLNKVNKHR